MLPHDEFREPVRTFAKRARAEVLSFSALIVFGSVARGEADRQSDIAVDLGETRVGESNDPYEYGTQVGVLSGGTKDELVERWKNHRNGTY